MRNELACGEGKICKAQDVDSTRVAGKSQIFITGDKISNSNCFTIGIRELDDTQLLFCFIEWHREISRSGVWSIWHEGVWTNHTGTCRSNQRWINQIDCTESELVCNIRARFSETHFTVLSHGNVVDRLQRNGNTTTDWRNQLSLCPCSIDTLVDPLVLNGVLKGDVPIDVGRWYEGHVTGNGIHGDTSTKLRRIPERRCRENAYAGIVVVVRSRINVLILRRITTPQVIQNQEVAGNHQNGIFGRYRRGLAKSIEVRFPKCHHI